MPRKSVLRAQKRGRMQRYRKRKRAARIDVELSTDAAERLQRIAEITGSKRAAIEMLLDVVEHTLVKRDDQVLLGVRFRKDAEPDESAWVVWGEEWGVSLMCDCAVQTLEKE